MQTVLVVLAVLAGACAEDRPPPPASYQEGARCPRPSAVLPDEARCRCDSADTHGTVWGTAQYAALSTVCTAAKHAGVIGGGGGEITVRRGVDCTHFVATRSHGVTTAPLGRSSPSFYFPSVADPTCSQRFRAAGPGEPVRPVLELVGDACPEVLPPATDGAASQLSCTCFPRRLRAGPIWGVGPYTLDSNVCAAAVHAGVVDAAGGLITVQVVAGCAAYPSSAANGITSHRAELTASAFVFANAPAACAS